MKLFRLVLFLTLILLSNSFAQWNWQNPVPTMIPFNSFEILDANTVIGCGKYGSILKTTNAGITWLAQKSNTSLELTSIFFTDLNHGWVVGENGIILKTTNSGLDWESNQISDFNYLNSVFFINNNIGWAAGGTGHLLKTTNGGNDWFYLDKSPIHTYYSIFFINQNDGWVSGWLGKIINTTDGGETWTTQNSYSNASIFSVQFITPEIGWAFGGSEVIKTYDGGNSWQKVFGNISGVKSGFFKDLDIGIVGGDGGHIIKTTDGGTTWQSYTIGTSADINCIKLFDNIGWITVTDPETIILKSTNEGITWNLSSNTVNIYSLNSIQFVNNTTGWSVGDYGTILKTQDVGLHWQNQNSGTITKLTSVYFIDQNTGWAVGDYCKILKTTNGGESWTSQTFEVNDILFDVVFINTNVGYAVGGRYDRLIMKTSNGGLEWQYEPAIGQNTLRSIDFIDSNIGWAVGSNGTIIKTTDGGINWNLMNSGYSNHFYSVHFNNSSLGWACGEHVIVKTTDGGSSWFTQLTNDNINFYSIDFVNANNGFVTGDGIIIKTTNGGLEWSTDYSFPNFYFSSVEIVESHSTWVSGSWGCILSNSYPGTVPVELESFSAKHNIINNSIELSWITASEKNNYGFDVEKYSLDNGWNKISFVKGYGTTTERQSYKFEDKDILNGQNMYRLKQIDFDGTYTYSQEISIESIIPGVFSLSQNYPNPFNPTTSIKYSVMSSERVTLKLYDVLGREVATLVNEEKIPGLYEVNFDGSNLSSGVYFYRIIAGDFVDVKKMMLIK